MPFAGDYMKKRYQQGLRNTRGWIAGRPATSSLTRDEQDMWRHYTSTLGNRLGSTFDPAGYEEFRNAVVGSNFGRSMPMGPGGGSGGGGGYGGGGGGGGGGSPALTQATIDAMARVLGAQGPQLGMAGAMNLPAFQGQNIAAFNQAPYTQALGQINQAVSADQANIGANQQAVTQAVGQNYSNPYANAQVAQGPQQVPVGAALLGTAGGTASPEAANQANQADQASAANFQGLMQVLAAADQQAQSSRMNQIAMDANTARQNLGAQATGMRGGVAQAQASAQQQWAAADQERRYQNSMLAQQWQREAMQRRQDLQNQIAQSNWQQQQQRLTAQLQPMLDLISRGQGVAGLNFAPLFQALGIAA